MKKSKRTSIRTKITLSLAATILIMVVMSCAITMIFIKKYFYHSMEQMLLDTYNSCNELFGRDEDIDSIPVMATGGPNAESIRNTIEAGADAICYTPATNGEIFKQLMDKYRANIAHQAEEEEP